MIQYLYSATEVTYCFYHTYTLLLLQSLRWWDALLMPLSTLIFERAFIIIIKYILKGLSRHVTLLSAGFLILLYFTGLFLPLLWYFIRLDCFIILTFRHRKNSFKAFQYDTAWYLPICHSRHYFASWCRLDIYWHIIFIHDWCSGNMTYYFDIFDDYHKPICASIKPYISYFFTSFYTYWYYFYFTLMISKLSLTLNKPYATTI